ncbi:hypothetical protein D3C77_415700 [compost metagenome]
MLGGKQGAALGFPVLAECLEDAIAPFAARDQGHGANHAIGVGAARDFAGFVFGSQAELEQLRRAALAGIAVVQGQGGDWQLRACGQLLDQWFFQRANNQLHAGGLSLAVEVIQ